MEAIKTYFANLLHEYKYTIVSLLSGATLYYLKSLFPEGMITPEVESFINYAILTAVVGLVGRFTRLKTSEVDYLSYFKK